MKQRADQLMQELARGSSRPLAPVYLVSGDEPLLVNEVLDALRAAAPGRGCEERESWVVDRSFSWDAVSASLRNRSLFSAGKLVEIRLASATPGDEGSRAMRAIAGREPDGNSVVVVAPALNRKTAASAWATALTAAGAWVETFAPDVANLPRWIGQRFQAAGLSATPEGLELLAARVEGNLLAAQQEIHKLALLHPPGCTLDLDAVRASVADGARFDVFQLADAALAGETGRAVRVLAGLKEEGTAAALVLWSLARDALLLVDAGVRAAREGSRTRGVEGAGVWRSRADLFVGALGRHKPGTLRRLLRMTGQADQIVKGQRPGDAWNALLELALAMAGKPMKGAELA